MFSRTVLSICLASATPVALAATVEVQLSGVSGSKGKVNVAVCDKEQFLKQCTHTASIPAGGDTVVALKDVPEGNWAILAYQDANENDKLDRNGIGMPTERYGFSNNARGKFGPPKFEEAAIEVRAPVTVAPVKLK